MARRRPNPRIRDMFLAIGILLVPILLISWFFTRVPDDPVRPVDWRPIAQAAAAGADYPVAVPEGLPDTWTVVRARWTPQGEPGLDRQPAIGDTWQLGLLTPDRDYIGLDQRDADPAGLVRAASRNGVPDGDSTVNGTSWNRLVTADGRTRSLVRRTPASVLVVSGDLPYEALEAFASTLGDR